MNLSKEISSLHNRKNSHRFHFFDHLLRLNSFNSLLKNITFYHFILTSTITTLSQFDIAQS